MIQKQHHIVNTALALNGDWSYFSEKEINDCGVLRRCSHCLVSLFGDNEASTPINSGAMPVFFYQNGIVPELFKKNLRYLLNKIVQHWHKISNCLIFALRNIFKSTVLSTDFTVSKHHTGVVSLNSYCSALSVFRNIEGATPYFFINQNIFSNAKHREKFTKHAYQWCVGNGCFTKRSCKSVISITRFTKLIAYSLAQYSNDVQGRIYQTYLKHQPFISFRLWRNIFYCVFRFKTAIAKPRCNSLVTPFLLEFQLSLCFYKHRAKFTRFY